MVTRHDIASLLGRPAEELTELDRRPLMFAFIDGHFNQIVLRDEISGDVFEITVSAQGDLVSANQLAARNQWAAAQRASVLDGELVSLLVRHPELSHVKVRITRASTSHRAEVEAAVLSAPEVVALADDASVTRIALEDDPVILDED